jgi:AcrR family transcriptional regulator
VSAVTEKAAPLTERGRRTRDKLLEAARDVFEEKGYAATRMSDIAARAGVSHGTTYTWFAD